MRRVSPVDVRADFALLQLSAWRIFMPLESP